MTDAPLQTLIEKAFEDRAKISPATKGEVRDAVESALDLPTRDALVPA
jgi:2,3,4,5-tetrahydropyridine-2,6-dicarboxylate N-succinyltransferase